MTQADWRHEFDNYVNSDWPQVPQGQGGRQPAEPIAYIR